MSDFQKALQIVLKHEGGYVFNRNDPGGETKYGISKRAYPHLDIKSLTAEQAGEIYRRDYWDKCRCDEMPYAVALMVFDAAVNSGIKRAGQWLQEAIRTAENMRLVVDGIIGPVTLGALRQCDEGRVIECYARIRNGFLQRLRTFAFFGRGWSRRVNETYRAAAEAIA